MEILNKNKLFFVTIISLIVLIGLCIVMIAVNGVHLWKQGNRLNVLKSELQTLLHLSPAPIPKNVVITTANLEELYKIRKEWYRTLGIVPCSQTPIECYLNIQKEVEFIKAQAKVANVVTNPKCYFGFFQYLSTEKLPKTDSLHALDRQCQIIKMLALALIQSSPKEILALTREPVVGETGIDDSLLNVQSVPRLKIHDIFYSNIFKLSFTGNTQTLRLFINKIERMQIPLFIRNIQVGQDIDDNPSLVVNEGLVVFSVTLELLDFKVALL